MVERWRVRSTASPRRSAKPGVPSSANLARKTRSSARPPTGRWRRSMTCAARSRTWYSFYDGYDPLFTWWMQDPYKGVDEGLAGVCRFSPPADGCRHDRSRRRFRRRAAGGGIGGGGLVAGAGGGGAGGGGGGGGGTRALVRGAAAQAPCGRRRRPARARPAGADTRRECGPNRERGSPIVGNPIGREALFSASSSLK